MPLMRFVDDCFLLLLLRNFSVWRKPRRTSAALAESVRAAAAVTAVAPPSTHGVAASKSFAAVNNPLPEDFDDPKPKVAPKRKSIGGAWNEEQVSHALATVVSFAQYRSLAHRSQLIVYSNNSFLKKRPVFSYPTRAVPGFFRTIGRAVASRGRAL
jgi:hypothetical protein